MNTSASFNHCELLAIYTSIPKHYWIVLKQVPSLVSFQPEMALCNTSASIVGAPLRTPIKKELAGPGRVVRLVRTSSWYTKVVGLIPG